jgi:hypothetical protein
MLKGPLRERDVRLIVGAVAISALGDFLLWVRWRSPARFPSSRRSPGSPSTGAAAGPSPLPRSRPIGDPAAANPAPTAIE